MSATVVSDWPMPTVSTRITSKPAASHKSMVSRVFAATPPSVPEEGEGRMKALRSVASRAMRVLSPRIEPPVRAGGGIDREHRDFLPGRDEVVAERVDGGGFSDARHAGDAHAQGAAGVGQQGLHEFAGLALVVGPDGFRPG